MSSAPAAAAMTAAATTAAAVTAAAAADSNPASAAAAAHSYATAATAPVDTNPAATATADSDVAVSAAAAEAVTAAARAANAHPVRASAEVAVRMPPAMVPEGQSGGVMTVLLVVTAHHSIEARSAQPLAEAEANVVPEARHRTVHVDVLHRVVEEHHDLGDRELRAPRLDDDGLHLRRGHAGRAELYRRVGQLDGGERPVRDRERHFLRRRVGTAEREREAEATERSQSERGRELSEESIAHAELYTDALVTAHRADSWPVTPQRLDRTKHVW